MSIAELRQNIIEKLQITDDDQLLAEVCRLLDLEMNSSDDYLFSTVQKDAIEQARTEIKQGILLSDEQANQEIDKWLEK